MAEIKLVAIDLDGTLLDDHKRLSPGNRAALERCLEAGIVVALASARDCASIHIKVPLERPGLYYLGSGGALIFATGPGKMLHETFLTHQAVRFSVAFLKSFGYPVFLNYRNDYWVDCYNDRVRMIEGRYNLYTRPFRDPLATGQPVMRVSLAAPVEVLQAAASQAQDALGDCVRVSLASPDWLDLLAPGAGKGEMLAHLQALLGLTPEQTAAFGDYDCDLPLFEHAGYRIAMGNAVESVKAASTLITGSNNQDGVAQALNLLL